MKAGEVLKGLLTVHQDTARVYVATAVTSSDIVILMIAGLELLGVHD